MGIDYESGDFIRETERLKELFFLIKEEGEGLIMEFQRAESYLPSLTMLLEYYREAEALCHTVFLEGPASSCRAMADTLGVLRIKNLPAGPEMVDWLLEANDHVSGWSEQMEKGSWELEPLGGYVLGMIRTALYAPHKQHHTLEGKRVLFASPDRSVEMTGKEPSVKVLTRLCGKPREAYGVQKLREALEKELPELLVLAVDHLEGDNRRFLANLEKEHPNLPKILLAHDRGAEALRPVLDGLGLEAYLEMPVDPEFFAMRLEQIGRIHFEPKGIKVARHPLTRTIDRLRPLPETVRKIKEIAARPMAPPRELGDAIAEDPVLAVKLLRAVNSPYYGIVEEISSIYGAVTMLGKDRMAALALQTFIGDQVPMNLGAYAMDANQFYRVSRRRTELMIHWYSKVSFGQLPVLTTCAMLGNMGQLLIAAEVEKRGESGRFREIMEASTATAAELECLRTTAEDVTADLLAHWGLDAVLVDAIRFSGEVSEAPGEILPLAIATYVVYNTVKSDGSEADEGTVRELADFLKEMNFNPAPYLEAVRSL